MSTPVRRSNAPRLKYLTPAWNQDDAPDEQAAKKDRGFIAKQRDNCQWAVVVRDGEKKPSVEVGVSTRATVYI